MFRTYSFWVGVEVWGLLVLGSLATVLWASTIGHAADWPQWRGPDRDGVSSETNWVEDWSAHDPERAWKADVGIGYSSVAVAGGRCITLGHKEGKDVVSAWDTKRGDLLWEHRYPCLANDPNNHPGPRSTPTLEGGRAYTLSRQGHLFCLNTETGDVLWAKHLAREVGGSVPTWGYACSPLIVGDYVIVEPGGNEGVLGLFSKGVAAIALDKKTGEIEWTHGTESAGYSSPVTFVDDNQKGVLFFHAERLVARELDSGKEIWSHPWKTSYDVNAATPIVRGSRVFISSGYNTGGAVIDFSSDEPRVVWRNQRMRSHFGSSVLIGGYLYGFDRETLKCLDFQTGKEQWGDSRYGKGALIAAGDRLIIQSDRGVLAVGKASPKVYKEISRTKVLEGRDTWVPPVLANGRIYCRHHDQLVCLNVRR